jgi:hypothetical protein
MAIPEVTQAFFELLDGSGEAGWRVRVSLAGEGFVSRAAPIVGEVGDVPLEAVTLVGDGGAVAFLGSVPPTDAPLRIGYLDTGLHETGITFPAQPNV